jgi:hypothetical protein
MIDRAAYFRSLASSLRPGGRVAILVFHPRGISSGLFGNRIAKEAAGYHLVDDCNLIDRQHFQIFARPSSEDLNSPDAKDASPKDRE